MPIHGAAHPVAQGAVKIASYPETVEANFRISNEQIFVAESIGPNAKPAASLEEMWERHASYVRDHVIMAANGAFVPGEVTTVTPPTDRSVMGFATSSASIPNWKTHPP